MQSPVRITNSRNRFGSRLPVRAGIILLLVVGCDRGPIATTSTIGVESLAPDSVYTYEVGLVFVARGEPTTVSHQFVLQNPSASDQMVLQLKQQSCGCTSFTAEPSNVPPGGKARITVKMDVADVTVTRRENVVLSTGIAEMPMVAFTLVCPSYARIAMMPEGPIRFALRSGETNVEETTVVVYQPANEQPATIAVHATGQGISVQTSNQTSEVISAGVRKSTVKCTIRTISPSTSDGVYDEDIYLGKVMINFAEYHISKDVAWTPITWIRATPRRMFVHITDEEHDVVKQFKLEAAQGFQIKAVEADDPYVVASCALNERSRRHDIIIRVKHNEYNGAASQSRIRVRTDHPDQSTVTLPILLLSSKVAHDG